MNNQEIARIFYEIADILEIKNIAWKPQAYRKAARAIDSMPEDIEKLYKKGSLKLLEQIPGVGEGLGKKIIEFLETGKINEYEKLKKQVSKPVEELMKIPGMGPEKIKKLSQLLKIKNIAQLKSAAEHKKIRIIPGFGEKSEQDILEGIAIKESASEKILLKQAEKIANSIIAELKTLPEVEKISPAGSLRRKKSTVRDIDILVASESPKEVISKFTSLKNIKKILNKGETKATIVLKSGLQVDMRVLPLESWGAGLFYFTGSKNYSIEMRKLAIKKGLKLNEYGLYDKQTNKLLAGRTEEEICRKLGTKFLSPEKREFG